MYSNHVVFIRVRGAARQREVFTVTGPSLMANNKPHALAVPLPFQGHIQPLMELSRKLASAGFMVTFANTQANHKRMKAQRKHKDKKVEGDEREAGEEGGGGGVHMVSLEDGFSEFENFVGVMMDMLRPAMKAVVAGLLSRLREKGSPVTLLIFDFRLLCVLDLALEAGIPSLSFWTQNAANFASNLLVAQGFELPPDDSMCITCVEGVPPFKRSEISGLGVSHYLSPFLTNQYAWEPFRRICEPTWVVLNTFEDLEPKTLDTLQERLGFRPLAFGPLVNAPLFSVVKGINEVDEVHSHLKWLHSHPQASVLYIAFGSVETLAQEELEELILGLEESEIPFLWVFRPDFCHNSSEYTLYSLSGRFENQGLVVSWTSQWHILSHPSVGGFLTHCGWNSTLEGITAGVPMLGWPSNFDRLLNRRCIEEQWGIGLAIKASEGDNKLVSRVEVHKKVRELIEGVKAMEVREKAMTLSRAAKRALEEGGSSHQDFAIMYKTLGVLT